MKFCNYITDTKPSIAQFEFLFKLTKCVIYV